jgi:MFS transporter, AAHS family, 3-hydroxyphenylpropionic acid transporter
MSELPPRQARMILALCAAAALFDGFDTQSMGVAAPRVIAEFALSTSQATFIFSAATIGLFLGAGIGGRFADLLGRKRTLIAALLLLGVCSLLTALATGPNSLLTMRFLTGLGVGGAMPNFIALSSESTSAERRISVVTMIMASMPLGGALAAAISLGAQIGWNWRVIFYVGGIVPIVTAILIMRLLPGPRKGEGPMPAATAQIESLAATLFRRDRAPTTGLLWTGFFFTQLVLHLMLNWLPSLVIGLGFSRGQAAWTSICFNLGGAAGAGFLGKLHAGNHRRQWVLMTYVGMAVALTAVASINKVFLVAVLACAFAGVFIIGAQLILFALAPLYDGKAIRGTGVGAAVAVGRLGTVVGPIFAGVLLAGGSSSATVLLGIIPFVLLGGSAAFALTWRKQTDE